MSYRFFSPLALLRAAIKAHRLSISLPGNIHTSSLLRLFRQQGFIGGFGLDLESIRGRSFWQGYPRQIIYPKYKDLNRPLIKSITFFKHTHSHFRIWKLDYTKLARLLDQNEFLFLSTHRGLKMVNVSSYQKLPLTGRPLLKIRI